MSGLEVIAADAVDVAVAIVGSLAEIAAIVLLVVVVVMNRARLAELLERLKSVKAGSLQFDFDPERVKRARPDKPIPDARLSGLKRRVQANSDVIAGTRVLWVDDEPKGNAAERRILRDLGVVVANVTTTDAALERLRLDDFDLVITNQDRPGDRTAGSNLVAAMTAEGHPIAVIGYIGRLDRSRGTPPGFRAMTDRPDELIHEVIDVAERREEIA
jgi:CheY-like chemotaxis protein